MSGSIYSTYSEEDLEQQFLEMSMELQRRGWVVVSFNADEVGDVDGSKVEERMIETGWDTIKALA